MYKMSGVKKCQIFFNIPITAFYFVKSYKFCIFFIIYLITFGLLVNFQKKIGNMQQLFLFPNPVPNNYRPIALTICLCKTLKRMIKETKSATMNIFRFFYFLFKSFVKVELSSVFTINLFNIAANCTEK